MKTFTGKTKGGSIYKGIYSTSQVPNHKPKRVRKSAYQKVGDTITNQMLKCNINGAGIAGAILTVGFAPLDIGWKICLAGMFLLSAIHVEVENDDK